MVARRSGPARWLYLVALGLFLLGVVVAGILAFISIRHFTNLTHSFTRVVAPGTSVLQLSKTGTYTIFYEYQSQIDGRTYSTGETPPNLNVAINEVPTGRSIDVHSAGSSSYSLGSRSGVSLLSFSIDHPGSYQISTSYPNGISGPDVVLAVGHGFARDLVGGIATIFGSIGVFCGMTLIAIILAIAVFIMRQRTSPVVMGPPAPGTLG